MRAVELRDSRGCVQLGSVGYGKGWVFYSKCMWFFFNCSIAVEVIVRFVLLKVHSDCWVENGPQWSRVEGEDCIVFLGLPCKLLPTWWLKTIDTYSLTVLEGRNPKSRC